MKRVILVLMMILTIARFGIAEEKLSSDKKDITKEFSEVIKKTTQKYPDGSTKEIIYFRDKKEIAKEIFDEEGNKNLTGKIPDGMAREYYESGKILGEWSYKDDKRNGLARTYYESGKILGEWNYKEDKSDGLAREYYENGKPKREWNLKDTKLNGFLKEYYESGSLKGEWNYKDDKLTGLAKTYFETGKLQGEWNYKDDKLTGLAKEYYENGDIYSIDTYKKDQKVNSKKYDRLGKLILDQDYPETADIDENELEQGVSDAIRTYFIKSGKYKVIERTKMDEVIKEQKLQLTGCTQKECAVEIGKILNVRYIVISSISKINKELILNIRIVNVESAEIITSEMEKCQGEGDLINKAEKIVKSISENKAAVNGRPVENTVAVLDMGKKD